MSEVARIDLVDRAPLTEKQQNVYESIMQYQRVNGYAPKPMQPKEHAVGPPATFVAATQS